MTERRDGRAASLGDREQPVSKGEKHRENEDRFDLKATRVKRTEPDRGGGEGGDP